MTARPAEAASEFRPTVARVLRLVRPYRRLSGVAVLGVGSIALNVCGPALLGHATDLALAHGLGHAGGLGRPFVLTLALALTAYLVSGTLWMLQGRFATRIIQQAVASLRADTERKLDRVPLPYLDRQPRGEVLSRTTNDIDNLSQSMQQTLSQITNSVLLLAGVLGMMFWISPLLAAAAAVTVPLSMAAAKAVGRRGQPYFAGQWAATGELNAHVEESLTGHAVLRLLGRQDEELARFRERNTSMASAGARAQVASGVIGPLTTVIGNIGFVAVAVLSGMQLAAGHLGIGWVQAFMQYSRQFGQPLNALANLANIVQSGVASAQRVFEFLDAPEEGADPAVSTRPAAPRGQVAFEGVAFRYPDGPPLIEDLSFAVEPGRLVAIVGPTGAGKTTLVNLLMRFYDVDAGRITVDGVDVRAMDRNDLRTLTGMVLQDTWLFSGTIAENIAYGRPGAGPEDIVAAAAAAHLDHVVRTLPQGYDTAVDFEGGVLSAGERQLITIARALLADPVLLILDEATSSVDTRTELLVQRAMARLTRDRTSFVIAHRLSTVRGADTVLMMEDGAIVEQGTHEQLNAAGGPYARLFAAQFARTGEELDPVAV